MAESPESGACLLPERGILKLQGSDTRAFLQGLISNDIERVTADRAIYAALLTPQGKFLFDFFIAEWDGALWLDCLGETRADLLRRLSMYKLRSDVAVEDVTDQFSVVAVFGAAASALAGDSINNLGRTLPVAGGLAFVDPRVPDLGVRLLLDRSEAEARAAELAGQLLKPDAYDRHRLALGVPEGGKDILANGSFLMDSNFDELHGVDHFKGCYIGQEITSRTKRRGKLRKRLLPVDFDGPAPESGTDITAGPVQLGTVFSSQGSRAIALIRLDRLDEVADADISAAGRRLRIVRPDWIPAEALRTI